VPEQSVNPGFRQSESEPIASVVVPTYQEAAVVATLIRRLDEIRERRGLNIELIIVDDNSPDGTAAAAHALEAPWVHVLERRAPRSLAGAVLDGFERAKAPILVVMDADLTHPPEAVPDLIAAVAAGAPMAIGSRYVEGGTTDATWPWSRRLASRIATLLVRPLVHTSDPLSGFFAIRRSTLAAAMPIRTQGFKIGLELLVRASVRSPVDVPITFVDRAGGASKASLREATRFFAQAIRLYMLAISRFLGLMPAQGGRPRREGEA